MRASLRDISFSKAVLLFLAGVMLVSFFCHERWKRTEPGKKVMAWDVVSYYGYLPALFVKNDLTLSFMEGEQGKRFAENHQYWHETAPNGGKVIKTAMGMSFMYLPFFLMAHAYAQVFGYEPDGFSFPYEFFIALSSIFYLLIGLFFLRRTLLTFFNERTAGITMVIILLGTNLYYYTTSEPAMSHAYSFSAISAFIWVAIRWHAAPDVKKSILLGALLSLIIMIRPVNVLIGIFPLLYGIGSLSSVRNKLTLVRMHWKLILILALTAFIVFLPQLLYWRMITGQWMFYSYQNERFFFDRPHILSGLFSFRNGWLIYSPLMGLSLIGIIPLYRHLRELFFPVVFFGSLNIYVCYSWWNWWYAGGFGSRPMIDSYAVLAIPLACLIQYWFSGNRIREFASMLLFAVLIALNLFQTWQFRKGFIDWQGMTAKAYAITFLQTDLDHDEMTRYASAIESPDYDKARRGE